MRKLDEKKLLRLVSLSVLFFLLSSLVFAQGGDESEAMMEETTDPEIASSDGYKQQSMQGFDFQWKVDGDVLDVIISGTTTGWISVGFDPTNRMKDANYVITRVENGDQVVVEDHYGTAPTAHRSDISLGGSEDIEVVSGSEENGLTSVNVRIPLVSGDQFDRPLTPGETYVIIWAYGPNGADNFTTIHQRRGFFRIEL